MRSELWEQRQRDHGSGCWVLGSWAEGKPSGRSLGRWRVESGALMGGWITPSPRQGHPPEQDWARLPLWTPG